MASDRPTKRLEALEFRAWRAFLYTYATVVPTLDRELVASLGLSLTQFEVLNRLRRAGTHGLRMSELASRLVLSPSGVTRAVDQLERRGLVERSVFEGDRRGSLATLTKEGRALLRRATTVHVQGLRAHLLDHMSRTELEHLVTALEAVLDGEGTPLPPLALPEVDRRRQATEDTWGPGPRPSQPCVAPMHRFATTVRPASRASVTASSVCVPGWNHSVLAPTAIALRAMSSASAGGRNTSTTSTGTSMSRSDAYERSPRTSPPRGFTGTIRYPCDWRYFGMSWPGLPSVAEAPTTAIVSVSS